MSSNSKWTDGTAEKHDASNLKVVLFKSRNKDNRHLENFKERTVSFVTSRDIEDVKDNKVLKDKFQSFVNQGVDGELSRWYVSLNSRDPKKVNKELMHYLLDHPELNPASLPQKLARISAHKENAKEHKWFFDFDSKDGELLKQFKADIQELGGYEKSITTYLTINGYAVAVENGFDTRKLLEKWSDVELKRDDLLLWHWDTTRREDLK